MTEYWVSQGNKWCEYCKCWMSNNPKSIAIHDQGPKHKLAVEERLKGIRRKAKDEQREAQEARRTMAQIEAAARKAYKQDSIAGRPEDMLGPSLPTAGGAATASTQAAVSTSSGQSGEGTASSSAVEVNWVWDSASNYWFDAASGFYYDSASQQYYNSATGIWQAEGPPPQAPRKRPPPPPPPKKTQGLSSEGGVVAGGGLENVPASMQRKAGSTCGVCGGNTVGCPACDDGSRKATTTTTTTTGSQQGKPGGLQGKNAGKKGVNHKTGEALTAFELGYGTLHPKFIQAAAKAPAKRARSPEKKELSEKEKEELARREAARARVQSRTSSTFGY